MKNFLLVSFFSLFSIQVFSKGLDPAAAIIECAPGYDKSSEFGHSITSFIIADMAGRSESDTLALTYFSQYPDAYKKYDAIVNATKNKFGFNSDSFTKEIVSKLHSLHGGAATAVQARRLSLEVAIKNNLKDPNDIWKAGLLIHSYADSYAHTEGEFNTNKEKAYSPEFGHLFHSLIGQDPDQVINPRNREKYLIYSEGLFNVLKNNKSNPEKFQKFKSLVKSSKCSKDKCLQKELLFKSDEQKIKKYSNCMNKVMKPLTKEQVQSVMDQIK